MAKQSEQKIERTRICRQVTEDGRRPKGGLNEPQEMSEDPVRVGRMRKAGLDSHHELRKRLGSPGGNKRFTKNAEVFCSERGVAKRNDSGGGTLHA